MPAPLFYFFSLLTLIFGERAEEEIDGQAETAQFNGNQQVQHTAQDGHVAVWRDDINAVWLCPCAVHYLHDLQRGGALEQLGHHAFLRRIKMLDNNIRHAAVFGHMLKELYQGLQPAR